MQLELHAYNPQHKLIAYLKSKGITPQAYSPLGSTNSPLLKDEVVVDIAKKHALQPADVLLGYLRMAFLSQVDVPARDLLMRQDFASVQLQRVS